MKYFYTYIDITTDGRPFYVGKGNAGRLTAIERNDVWRRISTKYGFKRRIIVFETLVEQWALDREVELIALLKTNCSRRNEGHWGANQTDGGEGTAGCKWSETARFNHVMSLTTNVRQRMRDSQLRRPKPNTITCRKMSEAARRWNAVPENKKHKSEAMKLYVRMPEHCANISKVHQKPITQLDLHDNVIAEFSSGIAAEEATGVSRSKICMVCKGIRPRAGGYHWRYKVIE